MLLANGPNATKAPVVTTPGPKDRLPKKDYTKGGSTGVGKKFGYKSARAAGKSLCRDYALDY